MTAIQQEFQILLKQLDTRHVLWGVIKELARIAGVLSDGQLITYATSLLGHPISMLSPRHTFLREFEVALKLSAEMKKHEETLNEYPAYANIQETLEKQIQEELKRYSGKFGDCYSQICQASLKLSNVPAVSVNEVRRSFQIPEIDVTKLETAKQDIWPGPKPAKTRAQVERELQKMLNENDQESLRIFAQAGYGPAIEKLYSTEPRKVIACHLVYALHFSNFAGIQRAVELMDIQRDRDILPLFLNIIMQVFPVSKISIDNKRTTIQLLYDKLRILTQPEDFLNSLLRMELFFLNDSLLRLQAQQTVYAFAMRTDAVFTVGYLLQLACVTLYDYFKVKDAKACKPLCQALLRLRQEIAGEGNTCYYITPDQVLQNKDVSLGLEQFDCSSRLLAPSQAAPSCCLL